MKPKKPRGDWRQLTGDGVALLRQGQPQQALKQLTRARKLAPQERDVRYWLANACRMTGATDRAVKIFEKLLAERPGDFDASFALAFLLREMGRPAAAATALLRAAEQPDVVVDQLLQIAGFLRDSNQIAAAIEVREKAVELRPDDADLHYDLGRLYQASGDFDRALAAFRTTLDLEPATGPAWTAMAQQRTFGSTDDAVFRQIKAAAAQSLGAEADMCVAFAFGKALDDIRDWPQAWKYYQKGNSLASRAMPWNPEGWSQFIERATSANPITGSVLPESNQNAVFIVGMPRSGTTLLEQLLGRHPMITGRGELNFLDQFAKNRPTPGALSKADREKMADILWTQMRLEGPDDGIYLDKNPLNFRYLDQMMELLPTAKVLHVTRDARDTCLSSYFQLFQHPDIAFSNRLDHLVTFYSGYQRVMTHWASLFADRIHDIRYEDLVNDCEAALATVVKFLGAEWDDALVTTTGRERVVRSASVWQSRQPVHARSIGRWKNYRDQAPDFFAELDAIQTGCGSGMT